MREQPKSLEQREIEDAIVELRESKECNPNEHQKVTKGLILSIRMHEMQLYQNEQIMTSVKRVNDNVTVMGVELAKVSKMTRPEAAHEQRRDNPTVANGGISFKGFKSWGLPAKIISYGVCISIVLVVLVYVFAKFHP